MIAPAATREKRGPGRSLRGGYGVIVSLRMALAGVGTATANRPVMRSATESFLKASPYSLDLVTSTFRPISSRTSWLS